MTDLPTLLEPISSRGWPPEISEALGAWRLHAAQGYSGRANACWPLGDPDRPLDEAIAAVEAWYGGRGLPPLFRPAEIDATRDLRQALGERGYRARTETLVMVGPLAVGDGTDAVRLSDKPDADFCRVFLATAVDEKDAAERIQTIGRLAPPRAFARLDLNGAPAAIGATAVEGQWTGLFGMRTVAEHRRKGLALRIIATLSRFSIEAGAARAYLQVEAANAPAVALYERLGFETAYRYRYWAQ
ncbi:MAG TPA: GNAT family N-acetyltransferase [Caulobacteraceae bacterium]